MAIVANESSKEFFQSFTLYTGVSPMKVVGICPTLEELQGIGFKAFDKEPVYTSKSDEGIDKVRIDVVFKNDKVMTKAAFFLENKQRESAKTPGLFEIINNFGQNTWATSVEEAVEKVAKKSGKKWFKPEGARIALSGEVNLINFIRDWANSNPEDISTIDSYSNLFKGNFKELQDLVKTLKNNTIYTLSTVKEGKYQGIYNGFFVRTQFSLDAAKVKFSNHVADQQKANYPLKETYSFAFQEYKGGVIEPDAEVAEHKIEKKDDIF